ncbi:hypothetical protein [Bacteroides sp.]|uniref:hypothetical protein n=1 Tax=Bacteroides sp. TaxID=29523 RepID=UPI0025C1B42D|nr:hypothetical protein [Bacteroides sp.]
MANQVRWCILLFLIMRIPGYLEMLRLLRGMIDGHYLAQVPCILLQFPFLYTFRTSLPDRALIL